MRTLRFGSPGKAVITAFDRRRGMAESGSSLKLIDQLSLNESASFRFSYGL